jgi:glycine cleavage system H protein
MVSADPFGKGWMVKIRMSQPAEVQQLLTPEQYEQQIAAH